MLKKHTTVNRFNLKGISMKTTQYNYNKPCTVYLSYKGKMICAQVEWCQVDVYEHDEHGTRCCYVCFQSPGCAVNEAFVLRWKRGEKKPMLQIYDGWDEDAVLSGNVFNLLWHTIYKKCAELQAAESLTEGPDANWVCVHDEMDG